MVVFTCNHCGESLQKPRVEKHYQASTCSRNPIAVSCMDCFKDFKLEEYVAHTKCVTEDERYSAKGTVHGVKKGEVKQTSWVQTVNSIIEQQQNAKPSVKRLLEMMSNYDNIPRKKVKFVNFVNSSSGGKIAPNDIEEVWSLLEAHKNAAKAETAEDGGKKKRKSDEDTPETNGKESSAPKKKKNQANEETSTETVATEADKSSKKKKRKATDTEEKVETKEPQATNDQPKKKNQGNEETSTETVATEADKSSKKKKRKATDTDEKVETKEPETVTGNDQPKKKKKKKGKTNNEEAQVNGKEEVKVEETIVSSTGSEEKQKKKKTKNGGQPAVNGDATENGSAEEKLKKKKKSEAATVDETPVANGESPKKKKSKGNNENGTAENSEPTAQNGTTDVKMDKSKKKNKQKETATVESNDSGFCWRTAITEHLKSQPKGIKKDKLKAMVFEQYAAQKGNIEHVGKLSKIYTKKIRLIGNIKFENDIVTWVE